MSRVSKLELMVYIKEYISSRSPGLVEMLDAVTMEKAGKSTLQLLFESPTRLFKILEQHYNNREAALFALENMFIRPIVIRLNRLEYQDKLLAAAISDDEKFKQLLRQLGVEL